MAEYSSGDRADRLVRRLKLTALFSVAGYLLFAYLVGWVQRHLATAYYWLPPAGAGALILMGLALLTAKPGKSTCCEGDCPTAQRSPKRAVFSAAVSLLLLLAPIALALAVQPKEFSSEGMRKRRLNTPRRDVKVDRAVDWIHGLTDATARSEAAANSLPKEPSILELIETVALADPEQLEGKFVTLVGRCDLPQGEAGRRFDLFRLLITCCVADASSVSIEVARNDDVRLEPGGWVRVGGVLKFDHPLDSTFPVLHAATIAKVAEPSEPYLQQ